MDLKQLEQLVAVCSTGSFTAAARKLGISQPTLSKSIGRLEKDLGLKLFDREGGKAQPNVFGRLVADHGADLLSGVERLRAELEQLARGESGVLRIGVGPATRVKLLPEVVREVGRHYPNLQLDAKHDSIPSLMRALRVGNLDLVFCYFEAPDELSDLIRVKIHDDRRIAVVRPRHPALRRAPLSPEMLLNYPIASVGAVPSFRKWVGAPVGKAARNMNAFVSDDYALVKARPIGSDFVACGPRFVFEQELRDGFLVELPLRVDIGYECWMLTTEARWRSPVVKKVAAFARTAMRRRSRS